MCGGPAAGSAGAGVEHGCSVSNPRFEDVARTLDPPGERSLPPACPTRLIGSAVTSDVTVTPPAAPRHGRRRPTFCVRDEPQRRTLARRCDRVEARDGIGGRVGWPPWSRATGQDTQDGIASADTGGGAGLAAGATKYIVDRHVRPSGRARRPPPGSTARPTGRPSRRVRREQRRPTAQRHAGRGSPATPHCGSFSVASVPSVRSTAAKGGSMKQLSGMDASFLYFETPNAPGHIFSVWIYDQSSAPGGKVTFKGILDHVGSRLHVSRTFRQRLVEVPLGLDHPVLDRGPGLRPRVPRAPHRPSPPGRLAAVLHPGGAAALATARPSHGRCGRCTSSRASTTSTGCPPAASRS